MKKDVFVNNHTTGIFPVSTGYGTEIEISKTDVSKSWGDGMELFTSINNQSAYKRSLEYKNSAELFPSEIVLTKEYMREFEACFSDAQAFGYQLSQYPLPEWAYGSPRANETYRTV